jgi:hypothetical protein
MGERMRYMATWVLAVCALCVARAAPAQNLVANPGFEVNADADAVPDNWQGPVDMVAWDKDVSHSGEHSLRFTNKDKSTYRLVIQKLPLKAGARYHVAAWVRGQDVRDGDEYNDGAGICLEWYDAAGNWLGGSYPSCVVGTFDWQPVTIETGGLPPQTAGGHVALYLRRNNTGTAWFDDVVVEEAKPPLLRAYLLSPAYRGEIRQPTAGAQVKVAAEVDRRDYDLEGRDLRLRLGVASSGPDSLNGVEAKLPAPETAAILSITLSDLRPGGWWQYSAVVEIMDGDTALAKKYIPLRVVPSAEERRVYVDGRQRLVVDGKPFFPLGLYLGPTEDEHLARIAAAGFNTILCYGYGVGADPEAYMERARAHGLKVIYSIKDFYDGTTYFPAGSSITGPELALQYVRKFRDHPALLAWYINDELGLGWLPKLGAMYNLVRDEDPQHPAFQVLCRPPEFGDYYDVTDILGVDPYPVPRRPVSMVTEWMETATAAMRDTKPVWIVPQLHKWAIYSGKDEDREPTYDEKRCMAFLGLIAGAKGMIFYSYSDLFRDTGRSRAPEGVFGRRWDEVTRIAADLRKVIPAALEGEPVTVDTSGSGPDVSATAFRLNGQVYVLAANASSEAAQAVAVKLGDARQGSAHKLLSGGEAKLEGKALTDTLPPLGVEAYVLGASE